MELAVSEYAVKVYWKRGSQSFIDGQYSRAHVWAFDGGACVQASSSPQIVPIPLSVEEHVDPEEAFVASLSSCHMLWFLNVAAKRDLVVDAYTDRCSGVLEKNDEDKLAVTQVLLKPAVHFSEGTVVSEALLHEMHKQAHDSCFIANSVKTDVHVEVVIPED